ncbi:hypothetical protein [Fibrobacter sp.]|uniref:hypothetical protein n=1 Tax=Fibrobacter sp. TaxID=35828 RepID=UPI00386C701A
MASKFSLLALFYSDIKPTLSRYFADEFFVRILFDFGFLRVEPLGEGVVDAAGRQERGGGFPLLFLGHYMLFGQLKPILSTLLRAMGAPNGF